MTERNARLDWPEGLDQFEINLNLESKTVRFSKLADSLRGYTGIRVSERRITGTLSGPSGQEIHAHVEARTNDAATRVDFSVHGSGSTLKANALNLTQFPAILASSLNVDLNTTKALVYALLIVKTTSWQSTVPIPINIPGLLDKAAGAPEVAGFEFAFTDPTSDLRRASVGVVSERSEYYVRLQLRMGLGSPEDLLSRIVSSVRTYSEFFITRLKTSGAAKLDA